MCVGHNEPMTDLVRANIDFADKREYHIAITTH